MRYRFELILTLTILTAMVIMFQSIYPGEEGMKMYINVIDVIIGTINAENPTYLFWIIMGSALFIQFYIPLFAIGFGAKLLPFKERDGKELLLSQKQSIYFYYIENVVLVIGLLILSILPSYIIIIFDLFINNALDSLPNINTLFMLAFIVSLFFVLLSGFGGIVFFSRSYAYATGGLYFAFSLVIGIISNTADIGSLTDLSIISRVNIIQNSINNHLPELVIFEIALLCILLFIGSLLILNKKDFIQKQSGTKASNKIEDSQTNLIKRLVRYIYSPVNNIVEKIPQPILRDQMNVLSWIFSLSVVAVTFVYVYMFAIYPGDEALVIFMSGFQTPIIAGPMFNHPIVPSIDGFLAVEIFAFSWIYYGPLILFATNSITLRDYNNSYSEITFSLSKTENNVYAWRTLGAIIYLLILNAINLVALVTVSTFFNYKVPIEKLITVFLILTIGYILFLVFFITLVLLVPYKWSQKVLILSFFYSIAIIIFAFAVKSFENLRFLSPFGYFDFVGIFYFETPITEVILSLLAFSIIVLGSFYLVVKYRVPKKDLA